MSSVSTESGLFNVSATPASGASDEWKEWLKSLPLRAEPAIQYLIKPSKKDGTLEQE